MQVQLHTCINIRCSPSATSSANTVLTYVSVSDPQQKEELTEYQAKYKIKIRENEGDEQEAADGEDAAEPSQPQRVEAGRQGVLVNDQ